MGKPSRIHPPLGPDNAWWWEQVAHGKLPIQRCSSCGKLRHPPRPMCDACRSMLWDFIEASGRGALHSFTVIHHPQFPGYEYPIVIALVDLEEGERMLSQLVDCERDAVRIGMPLVARIHEDPDGFKLPVFRSAL
ncbi:MAG TPA: Zn-ribbon domain-containing OB-fold protein [Myxococcota bacterium]|nr:Zn-ribbon domain-containing OB-fold protein [Myxococcota bacterium]